MYEYTVCTDIVIVNDQLCVHVLLLTATYSGNIRKYVYIYLNCKQLSYLNIHYCRLITTNNRATTINWHHDRYLFDQNYRKYKYRWLKIKNMVVRKKIGVYKVNELSIYRHNSLLSIMSHSGAVYFVKSSKSWWYLYNNYLPNWPVVSWFIY